jgi:hypothetical protein
MESAKIGFLWLLLVSLIFGAIRANAVAEFELSNFQCPEKVLNKFPFLDEEIPISIIVTNVGDTSGTYVLTLKIDGNVSDESRVTVRAGESEEVVLTPTRYGEPRKARWPDHARMTDAVYHMELDSYSCDVAVTPFPDFTVYFIGIDVVIVIGVAYFVRWISSPGRVSSARGTWR